MRVLLAFLLPFLAATARAAADDPPPEEVRSRARWLALGAGRFQGYQSLRKKGQYYDLQRVEITGMMSGDDTEALYPGMFDLQLKPSYLNTPEYKKIDTMVPSPRRSIMALGRKGRALIADGLRAKAATREALLSDHERDVVRPIASKQVNQIVAHSWGTELVYNAILAGAIQPPRELIIIGCPDRNLQKWQMLAKRTGTIVRIFGSDDDPVNSKISAHLPSKISQGSLLGLWEKRCSDKDAPCNPFARKGDVSFDLSLEVGHDRTLYYDALRKAGHLTATVAEINENQKARVQIEESNETDKFMARAFEELRRAAAKHREEAEQRRADAPGGSGPVTPIAAPPPQEPVAYAEPPRGPVAYAEPPSGPVAYAPPPKPAAVDLAALAEVACANPEGLQEQVVDRALWSYPDGEARAEGFEKALSGCSLQLFRDLMGLNSRFAPRPTYVWIKERARTILAPQIYNPSPDRRPAPGGGSHIDWDGARDRIRKVMPGFPRR